MGSAASGVSCECGQLRVGSAVSGVSYGGWSAVSGVSCEWGSAVSGREPLPDHAGESPLLSRSGGEKGLIPLTVAWQRELPRQQSSNRLQQETRTWLLHAINIRASTRLKGQEALNSSPGDRVQPKPLNPGVERNRHTGHSPPVTWEATGAWTSFASIPST